MQPYLKISSLVPLHPESRMAISRFFSNSNTGSSSLSGMIRSFSFPLIMNGAGNFYIDATFKNPVTEKIITNCEHSTNIRRFVFLQTKPPCFQDILPHRKKLAEYFRISTIIPVSLVQVHQNIRNPVRPPSFPSSRVRLSFRLKSYRRFYAMPIRNK